MSVALRGGNNSGKKYFLFVGFEHAKDLKARLIESLESLGGHHWVCEQYLKECTHLVCVQPWPVCKQKFLSATVSGTWIVVPEYLLHSAKQGTWLPERDYEWGATATTITTMVRIHEGITPEFVNAPRRNRIKIAETGHKLFSAWKAAVIIEDDRKRQAYEVILCCGGAKIIRPRLPIKNPVQVIRSTTHLFVEKQIPCPSQLLLIPYGGVLTSTDYIRSYILHESPPDISLFDVTKYSKNNDTLATPAKERFFYPGLQLIIEKMNVKRQLFNPNDSSNDDLSNNLIIDDSAIINEPKMEDQIVQVPNEVSNNTVAINTSIVAPKEDLNENSTSHSQTSIDSFFSHISKAQKSAPVFSDSDDSAKKKIKKRKGPKFRSKANVQLDQKSIEKSLTAAEPKRTVKTMEMKHTTTPEKKPKRRENIKGPTRALFKMDKTADVKPFKKMKVEEIEEELNEASTISSDSLCKFVKLKYAEMMEFELSNDELPSVPSNPLKFKREFETPKLFVSLFRSCVEENLFGSGLDFATSLSGPNYYPETFILSTLVRFVLQNPDDSNSAGKIRLLLDNIKMFHSAYAPFLSELYLRALSSFKEKPVAPWKTLADIISGCILNQVNCKTLLAFFVNIFKTDYQIFDKKNEEHKHKLLSKSTGAPIIATIMWYTSAPGTVSTPCVELISFVVQAITCKDIYPELFLLLDMLEMVAECIRISERANVEDCPKPNQTKLLQTIQEKLSLIDMERDILVNLLPSVKPAWLALALCVRTLDQLPFIHFKDRKQYAGDPISLRKIVSYYFKATLNSESPLKLWKKENLCDSPIKPAAVNRQNRKGETHLHHACMKNQVDRLKVLLNVPGIDINLADYAGWTPLHEAANHGHLECVRLLLEWTPQERSNSKPVDIFQTDPTGITALHDAVLSNQVEIVELLLKKGGRRLANCVNRKGKTARDMAETDQMLDLFDNFSRFHFAASSPHPITAAELPSTSQMGLYFTLLSHLVASYSRVHRVRETEQIVHLVSEYLNREITHVSTADFLDEVINAMRNRRVNAKELLRVSSDLSIVGRMQEHYENSRAGWELLSQGEIEEMENLDIVLCFV